MHGTHVKLALSVLRIFAGWHTWRRQWDYTATPLTSLLSQERWENHPSLVTAVHIWTLITNIPRSLFEFFLCGHSINWQDTSTRQTVSLYARLTPDFFLATRSIYEYLKFSPIISHQTLDKIIPDACDPMCTALKRSKQEDLWHRICWAIMRSTANIMCQYFNFLTFLFRRVPKLRKATISFVSVCLSVRPHETRPIFMKFYISLLFENLSRKFKFH